MGQQENQIMLIFIHVKTQPGYSLHVPVPFSACSGFSQGKEESQEHLKIIKNKVPLTFTPQKIQDTS